MRPQRSTPRKADVSLTSLHASCSQRTARGAFCRPRRPEAPLRSEPRAEARRSARRSLPRYARDAALQRNSSTCLASCAPRARARTSSDLLAKPREKAPHEPFVETDGPRLHSVDVRPDRRERHRAPSPGLAVPVFPGISPKQLARMLHATARGFKHESGSRATFVEDVTTAVRVLCASLGASTKRETPSASKPTARRSGR